MDQGYDRAINLRGQYKGLQAQILQQNLKALYVHCQAHYLNVLLLEVPKSTRNFTPPLI